MLSILGRLEGRREPDKEEIRSERVACSESMSSKDSDTQNTAGEW